MVVLLAQRQPGRGEPVALDLFRAAELLAPDADAPLHDAVSTLTQLYLIELVVNLFEHISAFIDAQYERASLQHLVLDQRIFVDQPVRHMLVQEGIIVEAGGEEAAQLGGVAAHGRVRVQGEAEDFKDHGHVSE